ncbi:MAG TPA: pre-peptidase C-terminal domain-containing protein [Thermoanaerobaculia bacterium]|nr:pre-peptidase C-terminal domain-containing protein [Thermoanaerobaculia bacterium]
MKKSLLFATVALFVAIIASADPGNGNGNGNFPTLDEQLKQAHAKPGSALDKLIRAHQNFGQLKKRDQDDRIVPPWLKVYWRKGHPEVNYDNDNDPTGGYPLVLKEIFEWMVSHQDLQPGPADASLSPARSFGDRDDDEEADHSLGGKLRFSAMAATVGTNVRTSGAQTVSRSESDIRINFWNPSKIIAASNNIGGSGTQGVYYSSDGGVTWGQTNLPLASGDAFHSDPTVEWTSDGTAWSSTMGINSAQTVLKVQSYKSTNGGATWTFDGTISGSQTNTDKQMQWVDHSGSSAFANNIYVIWHNGNPAFMNRRTSTGWGTPIQVSDAQATGTCIGADVKTNSAGDVFGFFPDTGSRGIYVVKSTNGGASYGTPVKIVTTYDSYDIGVPAFSSRRILIYVSGGAYKSGTTNNVYALWTDLSGDSGCTAAANEPGTSTTSTCKTRVWFSRSTDGGATWSARTKLNNQSGLNDQFNAFLAVDETNGNLGAIYYDTVADAGRKKVDVYYQLSTDGGATWEAAVKVTTAMTDETVTGADSGNQFGDYNSLSGYANSFFPSWTDRRNSAKEEIWTAKVTASSSPTFSISGNAGTTGATITAGSSSATSDASSNYSISGLAAGTYTVTPSKSGCTFSPASSSVTITSANVTGINFTANCTAPTFTISGNVGTSGATVTAGSSSATSDASGNYSMSGFVAGTYTVTPSKSGCTFSPASSNVTITSANVTANFTASCGSGDTQLTSGVPVTGQSVAASAWKYYYITVPAGATNLTFATSSATGDVDIYTQSGAKPTLSSYICRPYTSSGNETCSQANPAAGTWWLGVYGYAAGSFTVTGTVTTGSVTYSISGNAGTSGVTVTAGSASATSDASGNYAISGLAAGTYTVTPSKSGCTFSPASTSATITSANVTGINFTASCGSGDTQLTSGVAINGESVAAGAWKYYYITVPAGATNLTFTTTNATGDVDIYTQSGAKPTATSYVCRPYTSSGNETCSQANPAAGTWWLGVNGYAAGSYTVTGTVTTGGGGTTLFSSSFDSSTGWATAQVSGTAGAWTFVTSGTNPTASPHSGTGMAKFNSYDSASGSQTRVYQTTGFAIPSTATTATLTFWMYHDTAYSTSADKVQVQVSTGSTWTSVGTAVNRYDGSTGWKQHTIDLTAYKGTTVQLGFLGISAFGDNVFIDDAVVTTP